MKTLTVFYSLTGNTKKLAQTVTAAVKGDLLEIKLKKELPQNKFLKYFAAGRQLMKKEIPQIMPLDIDPHGYDLVFIGTPVWAATFAPAVRSFISRANLRNKNVALFCARGGDAPGTALENLEKELAGNNVVAKVGFKMDGISVADENDNLEKIADWAKNIARS